MAERAFDSFAYFRHAPRDRQDPFRGEHVDYGIRTHLQQPREHRLTHERIADPVWRDDEDAGQVSARINALGEPRL